jgi:hypothetical protein
MLDLGTALIATRKAFEKDNRNKMSKGALAKHLGHDSLSGPALGKLGALRAYGLIDGNGDELKITDDAVHALMAPEGSAERSAAMLKMATQPKLFQEIRKNFRTVPSAENLKFWLIKRQFASDAAEKAAKTYLATMRLVEGGAQAYDSSSETEPENDMQTQASASAASVSRTATRAVPMESNLSPGGAPLRVVMNGDRLDIQASVDLAGLKKLKEMLTKFEGILEMLGPNAKPDAK